MRLRMVSCLAVALVPGWLGAPVGAQEKKEPPAPPKKVAPPFPGLPGIEFDFPNFDELIKGLPLDPEQAKMLKAQLEKAREQYKKAMEDLRKGMPPGGLPGFPGGLPGFPGGFPGGMPPGLPG